MTDIKKGTLAHTLANPFREAYPVLKLEEAHSKTPFANTNGMINAAVDHFATAPMRVLTPVYTGIGGYAKSGVPGAAGGVAVGVVVGALAIVKDLVVSAGATAITPSTVAFDGADFLRKRQRDAASAANAGATALTRSPRTAAEQIVDLASNPTSRPLEIFSTTLPPKAGDFGYAQRDLAEVGNRIASLPARVTTPFVSAYGAFSAASDRPYAAVKAPLAASAAFVGGAVNAVLLGATSDIVAGGWNLLTAAGNAASGLAKIAAAQFNAAFGNNTTPPPAPPSA